MDYRKAAETNMILKARVGSHLFGTNTPESDIDMEGIFIPPVKVVYGLGKCKEVNLGEVAKDSTGRNTSDAVDFKLREYREFVRLALQNNPNILNVLFVNEENIFGIRDAGSKLLECAEMFPHRKGLERFIGYATSQMKKMGIKPDNYDRLKRSERFLDGEKSDDVLVSVLAASKDSGGMKDNGPGKHVQIGDIFVERNLLVRAVLKKIRIRLSRASARAAMWEEHRYDCKFASNLIQILYEGIELAKTGRLSFPLDCASYILEIKNGDYSLEHIEKEGERLIEALSRLKRDTGGVLPAGPRYEAVEQFLIGEMRLWVGSNGYV